MYRYQLALELIDGNLIQGIAVGTVISNKKEFLIIENNHKKQNIRLDKIKQFTALTDNAAFKTIKLT